jgi:glycine cleavage system aminomethyltransferase T
LLERLYPTNVATIKPQECRPLRLAAQRARLHVLDDGLICNDGENRYTLTFTSRRREPLPSCGCATGPKAWGLDVRILNQTMALGAINVTGPLAKELLSARGPDQSPKIHATQ